MALNWNVENCKNYKQLIEEPNWVITNALIWATMAVRLGEITKHNVDEFHRRLNLIEKKNGTFLSQGGQPLFIPKTEVKKRIGLHTNVGNSTAREFDTWYKKALAGTKA